MSLWPFGRGRASVELVSRVVSAVAADGTRLRGKLTLYFASPLAAEEAERAGDVAALATTELFANTFDHKRLLGREDDVSVRVRRQLGEDVPSLRALELRALHVVKDEP